MEKEYQDYTELQEEQSVVKSSKPSNIVEFDLDRLVEEIDSTFQDKNKEAIIKFGENCDTIQNSQVNQFTQTLHSKLNDYQRGIQMIVHDHKQDLLDEISRGRTLITIANTGQNISVGHMDHPEMESVIKTTVTTKRLMMVGPAGTGKTTIAAQMAEKLGLPFYKYSCSRDSSVFDLLGYKQPTSEQYLETSFLKCYENGGIFLVDEYDAMSGDMSLFFNGIADNSSFISVPHRDVNPTAKKHKDFYIIMCGNTWGKGSHEFTGRDFQDAALMDRFRYSRHYIGYHKDLERRLAGSNYAFIEQLRSGLESTGSYLSTRNVEDISIAVQGGRSLNEIVKMSIADLTQSDRDTIVQKVKNFL